LPYTPMKEVKGFMSEMALYFDDLKPEAQRRVLRFLGLKSPEEANLDVSPIAIILKTEPEDNLELICDECAEKRYGKDKGGFTKKTLKDAAFVKALFGKEHMWVKVKEVREDCVVGTVDNVPVFPDSPRFGEEVKISFREVEDVILKEEAGEDRGREGCGEAGKTRFRRRLHG